MGKTQKLHILCAFLLTAQLPLAAAPAAPGVKSPEGRPTCYINAEAARARVRALKTVRTHGAPMAAPPTNATPKIYVVRVEFQDKLMGKTLIQSQPFFSNMRSFFIENSYGAFQPTFTLSPTLYKLPKTLNSYGSDTLGNAAYQLLFTDTKALVEGAVDFTQYDEVMIYHAGNGQETSGLSQDIWSVYFPTAQTLDGKSFNGFTVVPETEAGGFDPLGVITHEYGHQLGLPDLYDTAASGGRSTCGAWSVMDYPYTGITTADGSNPPHLDAWCKKFLGFASVQSLSGTVSHSPSETTRTGVNQLAIPVGGTSEYFLVEYRLRSSAGSYDKGLPMDGLAVWHIDDAIALNTTQLANNTVNSPSQNGFNHLGIDLVEADGTAANPQNSDLGIGDAYADGQTFAAPYSNSFSGQPSGVTIANIAGVGTASVNSSVAFIQATTALTVAKTVNYPNPAGDTKKYPVRAGAPAGTITTFVAQFSRPVESSELQLDIYNLRGDRIKGISGPEITLKIGAGEPSSDYKWVYEYDWNGKNDSGDEIVSGVYLYRFKAQEEVKTGKVMIVR